MMSAGGAKYHSTRCLVASSISWLAWRLNGLAVATRIDLLNRSNGKTHQRRHVSTGKVRASSTSTSYLSSGKNPKRPLSEMIFNDFSSGVDPFSANTWMKGSITFVGGVAKSGSLQHCPKTVAEIILPSTKIFCIA